jgi:hypothetical protein
VLRWLRFTLAFVIGCATTAPVVTTPDAAVRRYVDAVRAGDARTAYALLDVETRERVTLEAFERRWRENPDELRDQAAALERALASGVTARAEVDLAASERVALSLESGRWRVDGALLPQGRAIEPIDAIFAMRRVLARGSLDALWALLPRERRAELEAEAQRFLDDTADPYDLVVEIRDDVADVRTTSGRTVHLVREAGTWRIASLAE